MFCVCTSSVILNSLVFFASFFQKSSSIPLHSITHSKMSKIRLAVCGYAYACVCESMKHIKHLTY